MTDRLKDIPVYEHRDGLIEGHYYNHVQIALKRLSNEIRIEIPGLKHLDLILDNEAWIIVDRVHADVPIAAWSDFEVEHRSSLSEPIKCMIRTYHISADIILERVLDSMEVLIDKELVEKYGNNNDTVAKLIKK
ncbi:MAG: hypothetical protein OEX07_02920 [Gammaproteobacteria bacterium]|nr:hypothetical protein [Gammaproteobacteria bacterium]